ncbi:UDP-galactose-4-epimerase [Lysobacter maris]|nr:UDP-galactose-4-epimerase [Lysobacter maris]
MVLIERGHEVVVVDNFRNSSPEAITRLESLLGLPIAVDRLDLRDRARLARVFARHRFDAVVHFAALKAVGESCQCPLEYFDNNIGGSIALLQEMAAAGVKRLVFSSSATVYGMPESVPVREDAELKVTNPYGRTKLVVEQLLADVAASDPAFQVADLRYFNPVGAHPSGLIGEAPDGPPNNLMPYVCQVAAGRRERLQVFGGDYPTRDGTGVRDYLHVVDLARAHADALDYLVRDRGGLTVNLGTGSGISVLELVRAFEAASERPVPYEIVARRPGDVAEVFADPSLAYERLGWRAEFGVEAMCRDAWRWQALNPDGYRTRLAEAMRARAVA